MERNGKGKREGKKLCKRKGNNKEGETRRKITKVKEVKEAGRRYKHIVKKKMKGNRERETSYWFFLPKHSHIQ